MNSLLYSNKRYGLYFMNENWLFDFCSAFCFYYCFMLFMFYNRYEIHHGKFEPIKYLGLVLVFFLIYLLFDKIKNVYSAVIAALGIMILTVRFYPINGNRFLLLIPLIVFIIFRFQDRHKYQTKLNIWRCYGIVFFIVMHIITSKIDTELSFSSQKCLKIMCGVFVIYLILFLCLKYIRVLDEYYCNLMNNSNKNSSKSDKIGIGNHIRKSIFLFNISIAGIGIIIFLITQYFTNLVSYVFSVLNSFLGGFKLNPIDLEKTEDSVKKFDIFVPKGSGNNYTRTMWDSELLKVIFNLIFTIVVIAAILFFIRFLYRKIYGMKKFSNDKSDEIINISEIDKDAYSFSKIVSKIRYGNSAKEQIRRHYYDLIMHLCKNNKIKDLNNKTVKEIEESIINENNMESFKKLSHNYEQARYSDEKMSMEVVYETKKLCKDVRKL